MVTQAVCLQCGNLKHGAFNACGSCSFAPKTERDLAYSLAFTDHYLEEAQLRRIGEDIKAGLPPPRLSPDQEEQFRSTVKDAAPMLGLREKGKPVAAQDARAPSPGQQGDPSTPPGSGSDPGSARALGCLVVIIAIVIVGVIANNDDDSKPRGTSPPTQRYVPTPPRPRFTEPAQPTPYHGRTWANESLSRPAPLTIKTRLGKNYYIKLVSTSGTPVLYAFIHGGRSADLTAPLGSYRLRYAAGDTWYGPDHLFGPETIYSEADAMFNFTEDYTGYSGYTVELILQTGGNLSTRTIDASRF